MNEKWTCNKCHSINEVDKTRCGFCGNPKPEKLKDPDDNQFNDEQRLSQSLHNIIERMTYTQKRKIYRWLEDNIL